MSHTGVNKLPKSLHENISIITNKNITVSAHPRLQAVRPYEFSVVFHYLVAKLTSDITDRQKNRIPRRFAGGQKVK